MVYFYVANKGISSLRGPYSSLRALDAMLSIVMGLHELSKHPGSLYHRYGLSLRPIEELFISILRPSPL